MPDLFCEALIRHNEELGEHGEYLKSLEDEIKKKGLERNFAETVLCDIPIGTVRYNCWGFCGSYDRFLMYDGQSWTPISVDLKGNA